LKRNYSTDDEYQHLVIQEKTYAATQNLSLSLSLSFSLHVYSCENRQLLQYNIMKYKNNVFGKRKFLKNSNLKNYKI